MKKPMLFLVLLLTISVLKADGKRQLNGKVVRVDTPTEERVPNLPVHIEETKSNTITADRGTFLIPLPAAFAPGTRITFGVSHEVLRVYEPPNGRTYVPKDRFEVVRLALLPKGSRKFLRAWFKTG